VVEVVHYGVIARKIQSLLAALPTYEVRRTAVEAVNLENLAVPVDIPDLVPVDHDAITDAGFHGVSLLSFPDGRQSPGTAPDFEKLGTSFIPAKRETRAEWHFV
jgi:hypothetical protein